MHIHTNNGNISLSLCEGKCLGQGFEVSIGAGEKSMFFLPLASEKDQLSFEERM